MEIGLEESGPESMSVELCRFMDLSCTSIGKTGHGPTVGSVKRRTGRVRTWHGSLGCIGLGCIAEQADLVEVERKSWRDGGSEM